MYSEATMPADYLLCVRRYSSCTQSSRRSKIKPDRHRHSDCGARYFWRLRSPWFWFSITIRWPRSAMAISWIFLPTTRSKKEIWLWPSCSSLLWIEFWQRSFRKLLSLGQKAFFRLAPNRLFNWRADCPCLFTGWFWTSVYSSTSRSMGNSFSQA